MYNSKSPFIAQKTIRSLFARTQQTTTPFHHTHPFLSMSTTTDLSRLKFDAASHTYTLDGDKPFVSVSYVIKQCFPEFNADATIAKMRANKDRFERGPYANMSDEEIKAQWEKDGEIARDEGTLMHANIEASL
jgi:hypothetical protein